MASKSYKSTIGGRTPRCAFTRPPVRSDLNVNPLVRFQSKQKCVLIKRKQPTEVDHHETR